MLNRVETITQTRPEKKRKRRKRTKRRKGESGEKEKKEIAKQSKADIELGQSTLQLQRRRILDLDLDGSSDWPHFANSCPFV